MHRFLSWWQVDPQLSFLVAYLINDGMKSFVQPADLAGAPAGVRHVF